MSTSNNQLFLDIAGFCICLIFSDEKFGKKSALVYKDRVKNHYSGFVLNGLPKGKQVDYKILFNFELRYQFIQSEKKRYIIHYEYSGNKEITTFYHISDLQLQLILRDVCQQLLSKNEGMIVHGSASLINGKASVFLGKSGAGKSTCAEILSLKYKKIADDIFILRRIKSNYFFFQTPFPEKNLNYRKSSKKIKLGNVYILKKSNNFIITQENNRAKILGTVLQQLFTEEANQRIQVIAIMKMISEFKNFSYLEFALGNNYKLIELVSK